MFNEKKYSNNAGFEAIFVLIILLFGLLFIGNPARDNAPHKKSPVELSVSDLSKTAVYDPYLRIQVYQKSWVLNKDHYNLLAFSRSPLSEGIKAKLKVSSTETKLQKKKEIPSFLVRYHLFPTESDDYPGLS